MTIKEDNTILNIFKQYNTKNKSIEDILGNTLIADAKNGGLLMYFVDFFKIFLRKAMLG